MHAEDGSSLPSAARSWRRLTSVYWMVPGEDAGRASGLLLACSRLPARFRQLLSHT
jgi:hypothetical protein